MDFVAAKCPNCNGDLQVSTSQDGRFFCQYCGGIVMLQTPADLVEEEADHIKQKDFVIEGGILKEYHGKAVNIAIPENVIVIGEGVFENTAIKNVFIPDTVREIRKDAFANCLYLKEVTLPNGLAKVDLSAFSCCNSLEELAIPSSVCDMTGYGDGLSLVFSNTSLSISSILNCRASKLTINAETGKELASQLLIQTASWSKIPCKSHFWAFSSIGKWPIHHVVVPGFFDYSGYDCGQRFIDAMLSCDEQNKIKEQFWRNAGVCEKCGGLYQKEDIKRIFGKNHSIWKCQRCGHTLFEKPMSWHDPYGPYNY